MNKVLYGWGSQAGVHKLMFASTLTYVTSPIVIQESDKFCRSHINVFLILITCIVCTVHTCSTVVDTSQALV